MDTRPVLIGVPYDASSSFRRGAADAPPRIREALNSGSGNPWSERLVRVEASASYEDRGDLVLPPTRDAVARIEDAFAALGREGRPFVALGGDHSITYPILKGLAGRSRALTILQIDAHPDLYDAFEGDRLSHACPFARIMEDGLATRLVQVGIRATTPHQQEQARRFGVEQIDMLAWADEAYPALVGDVYVSIDLDGIDPAFAPGVSHREPAGLTVRDVLKLIESIDSPIVGADVVEFNPSLDVSALTAGVAAKLTRELLAKWERPA
jgi:agmatinase